MHYVILETRFGGIQIELYNTMLEKEGTVDEEEARRAYRVAREESDRSFSQLLEHATTVTRMLIN